MRTAYHARLLLFAFVFWRLLSFENLELLVVMRHLVCIFTCGHAFVRINVLLVLWLYTVFSLWLHLVAVSGSRFLPIIMGIM